MASITSWRHPFASLSYDYTQRGAYFVTICTHERALSLDDPWMKMVVEGAWQSVTGRRPPAYDFVVMPNHVHGIIWLPGPGRRAARNAQAPQRKISGRIGRKVERLSRVLRDYEGKGGPHQGRPFSQSHGHSPHPGHGQHMAPPFP